MDKMDTTTAKNKMPDGWVATTVGDVFDFIGGGTPNKNVSHYWGGEIPWATVKDIKGKYLFDTIDHITENGFEDSAANLAAQNDFILCTRISPGEIDFIIKSAKKNIEKFAPATAQKNINLKILEELIVPCCSPAEQKEIVDVISQNWDSIDHLTQTIDSALTRAELLRQSILKKAFSGKLVPQDPNDEPASELLKRIQAEREKAAQGHVRATGRSLRSLRPPRQPSRRRRK